MSWFLLVLAWVQPTRNLLVLQISDRRTHEKFLSGIFVTYDHLYKPREWNGKPRVLHKLCLVGDFICNVNDKHMYTSFYREPLRLDRI